MDYLSVEEAAVLKNCSARYIRKQCKNGVLPAVLREHPQNHKPCYQIPVSAFPEPLQARYYQQKRQEMGMMPTPISAETKPQKPKKRAKAVRQMTIEDCTAQQRRRSRSGQQFCWNGTPDASSTARKPTMTSCMWASVSWSTQTYRFPRGSCTANGTPIRSMISPVCWGYGAAGTSTAAVFPRSCGRRFCGSGWTRISQLSEPAIAM